MKVMKSLSYALLVCAAATFTLACQSEDNGDLDPFYQPDDAASLSGKAGKGGRGGAGGAGGALNLDPNGLNGGAAGAWGSGPMDPNASGNSYAEGVGARIPGVNFESVYFLFDQNTILATQESKLITVANYLRAHPEAGVVVEGNCDERGTTEYNRALGEKRAIAAKTFLLEQGIDESRVKTVSYGEERPAVPGSDESAFEKNRRDDLVPVYLLR